MIIMSAFACGIVSCFLANKSRVEALPRRICHWRRLRGCSKMGSREKEGEEEEEGDGDGEATALQPSRLPLHKITQKAEGGGGCVATAATWGNDGGAVFVTPDLHVNCCGGGGGGGRQIISAPNCLLSSRAVLSGDFSYSRGRKGERERTREEAWITSPSLTHSLTPSPTTEGCSIKSVFIKDLK